jgi:hypothetical protein
LLLSVLEFVVGGRFSESKNVLCENLDFLNGLWCH